MNTMYGMPASGMPAMGEEHKWQYKVKENKRHE